MAHRKFLKKLIPAGTVARIVKSDQNNPSHSRYMYAFGFTSNGSFLMQPDDKSKAEKIHAETIVMTLENCRYDGSPKHANDPILIMTPDGRIFRSRHVCLDLASIYSEL